MKYILIKLKKFLYHELIRKPNLELREFIKFKPLTTIWALAIYAGIDTYFRAGRGLPVIFIAMILLFFLHRYNTKEFEYYDKKESRQYYRKKFEEEKTKKGEISGQP